MTTGKRPLLVDHALECWPGAVCDEETAAQQPGCTSDRQGKTAVRGGNLAHHISGAEIHLFGVTHGDRIGDVNLGERIAPQKKRIDNGRAHRGF